MAGGPGDRWFRRRSGGLKAAATKLEREESPDTVLRDVDRSAFIKAGREAKSALSGCGVNITLGDCRANIA